MRAKAEAIIDEITGLLNQLSSAERRVLQRRLRVSGLLEREEIVADRNRLEVATALGVEVVVSMTTKATAHTTMATKAQSNPVSMPRAERFADASALTESIAPTDPSLSSAHATSHLSPYTGADEPIDTGADEPIDIGESTYRSIMPVDDDVSEYQSAISGKFVVGTPSNLGGAPDPHMMSPLPGQAPEHPIRVVFDGGSKGNPGAGYGSYALDWPGLPRQIVQLQFGNSVTNNEAEYDTLIAALEGIITRLEDQKVVLSTAQLDIRGDSELVIKQVRGEYECKSNRMRLRRNRVVELLEEFDDWTLVHHGREHSVRILGH